MHSVCQNRIYVNSNVFRYNRLLACRQNGDTVIKPMTSPKSQIKKTPIESIEAFLCSRFQQPGTNLIPRSPNWINTKLARVTRPVGGRSELGIAPLATRGLIELVIDRHALSLPNAPTIGSLKRCGRRNDERRRCAPTPVAIATVPRSNLGAILIPGILPGSIHASSTVRVVRVRAIGVAMGKPQCSGAAIDANGLCHTVFALDSGRCHLLGMQWLQPHHATGNYSHGEKIFFHRIDPRLVIGCAILFSG